MPDRIVLVGETVRLRSTVPEDAPALIAIRRTEPVHRRWGGEDLEAEFAQDLEDDAVVRLTIEVGDRIVGLIQFAEEDDTSYRHASVDIYVDPAVHRRGHATDAIRTLADHLFDERHHHRITIDPTTDNRAAIRCYTRVGFRPVGVMREYERRADGSWTDGLLMEMLASDRHTETHSADPAELEMTLLDPATRSDRGALDQLLHRDFVEIGASGRTWSRDELIDRLTTSADLGPLVVADLATHSVSPGVVLVTYRTATARSSAHRSSLWVEQDGRWQVRFHQGTSTDGATSETP